VSEEHEQTPDEAPETTPDQAPETTPDAAPVAETAAGESAGEPRAVEDEAAEEAPAVEPPAAEAPAAAPTAATPPEAEAAEEPSVEEPAAEEPAAEEPAAEEPAAAPEAAAPPEATEPPRPREKPAVPGADLEVDIVPEGVDPLTRGDVDPYAVEELEPVSAEEQSEEEIVVTEPIAQVAIDLAADARYSATGKRKTAIARVILRPGTGAYSVNGRSLEQHFPRVTLQRNIRQPLETVGYEARMDVVARLEGGGISSQAGALRHGISRALLEADPNLRGELKRRGFLTRDARAKERKKAGLKKARKRPQFSKR
jgi:small subunit ribosomal protein S9